MDREEISKRGECPLGAVLLHDAQAHIQGDQPQDDRPVDEVAGSDGDGASTCEQDVDAIAHLLEHDRPQ